MGLEARIEALELARLPKSPDLVFLVTDCDDRGLDRISIEGRVEARTWTRLADETNEHFHDRVIDELHNPPGTSHVFFPMADWLA